MNVAIISQGPSASLWTGEREGYDLVVGVNAIPTQHPCDWWVFVDYGAFIKPHPDGGRWCDHVIGTPKIATRPGNRERLSRERPELSERLDAFQWSLLPMRFVPALPIGGAVWTKQGGLAALGLAWSLKPDRIDTFGVDMEGQLDALGCECHNHNSRNPARWERERFTWAAMVGRMAGIEVRKAHPNGVFEPWSPANPTGIVGITSWQYDNGHGWTSYTFPAAGEDDFRKRLARMIGPTKAGKVPVRQVA